MKRKQFLSIVSLMLVLALFTGCTGTGQTTRDTAQDASAEDTVTEVSVEEKEEEADAEDADWEFFPALGTQMNGFTLNEVRLFPLIGAEIGLFEHDKTGALCMYIHNDDVNRTFDLTFLTRSIDNTGLPHVFEHATLDGSEKYPSKELFFNLVYQTYQTYMNAMTAECITTYPNASLSEAQLLKLADFYTDSCFHPLIMEDESIWREEAWRYRLADKEDDLTIEGTVYSEMLGAMDKSRWAYYNTIRTVLPGSYVGYVFGGDPEYIPDMTYESLKNFHDLYYHPSNCVAYLYGDIEDYGAFLELLDTEFSKYEKKEFTHSDDDYEAITESVTKQFSFAAEEGTQTKDASVVCYSIICDGLNTEEQIAMSYLLSMLSEEASDLSQQIKKKLPTGTFSCDLELSGAAPLVTFAIEDIDAGDAKTFQELIDDALKDVAENSFPEDLVDGVMARTELENKLIREGTDIGVNLILYFGYAYAQTGDPWYQKDFYESASRMQEWNTNGTFAQLAETYLTSEDVLTALVTTTPEPGLKEKQDAALTEKLAEIKSSMSEEEIDALVAQTLADDAEEADAEDGASDEASTDSSVDVSDTASADDTEAETGAEETDDRTDDFIAQLTAVTVEDLPEEVRAYEVTDETDDNGVRHLNAVASVEGVGFTQILLDASAVKEDALHDLALFVGLTGYLDTDAHTRGEIETLSTRYLYEPSIEVTSEENEDGSVHPYLTFGWIANEDDLERGYELMNEILFDLKLDDAEKLLESVKSIRSDFKSMVNAVPYQVSVVRGLSLFNDRVLYQNWLNGLEYYAYLEETEAALEDETEAEEVITRLQAVQELLHNATNAAALFAGSEESIAVNEKLVDAFLDDLGYADITPETYDLIKPEPSEGLIVESAVQYNGVFAGYEQLGLPDGFSGSLDVLANVVNDMFLYPMLRDQYGAYGVMHYFNDTTGTYIVSYRDPNVTETYDVYEQLADLVKNIDIDQETLDGYILSSYVTYAMPDGELTGALRALNAVFEGEDADADLQYMREIKETTPEMIREYASVYEQLMKNGSRGTSGGAAAVNAHEDLFDAIYNPFAAEETEVAEGNFDDLTEDHPLYGAVMDAYGMGMLDPLSEDHFGVDDDASIEDYVHAVVTAGGLSAMGITEDYMIEQFKTSGILKSAAKAEDPLTTEIMQAVLDESGMGGMLDLPDYVEGDVITRGELARLLTEE